MKTCLILPALLASAPLVPAQEPATDPSPAATLEWDARAARHLLNRAGFGARPAGVEGWVEAGQRALIERLFLERGAQEPFFAEPITYEGDRRELRMQGADAIRSARNQLRARNRRQQQAYLQDWVEAMLRGEDPLRDRMALFWHGLFTSQASKVKDSYLLVRQSQLLREHALGNYGELLRAILRDPAMLVYLDNESNRKDHPNENLARELLELFTLGEGNYSEQDVKQVARALTGYAYRRGEGFTFAARTHDFGRKTVLGDTARHDADSVVDVILAQPACGRWIAGRLIGYLEGVAPEPARLEEYASLLRGGDYELEPFLRALFADPRFYRPEVVGARVQSPLDYLVGSCRRLGLRPHPGFVLAGAGLLGEQLFEPPNVKGWEGGEAWITTSTFMARGNLAGVLLGVVEGRDLEREAGAPEPAHEAMAELGDEADALGEDDSMMMEGGQGQAAPDRPRRDDVLARLVRLLDGVGYQPRLNLVARLGRRGVDSDREIVDTLCDELLAIEAPLETRRMLVAFLRAEREALGAEPGALLESGARAEHVLRRLAHLILSLPEAQLG